MACSRTVVGLALFFSLAPQLARAATIEVMPGDDLQAAIAGLEPGDELVLHGGMYVVTARLGISVTGTEAAPIVIRAAAGEVPHVHRPDANQNIMDIDFAEHVEIRGIEFSGGSAGVRISSARYLTIAECEIHGTNDVALRANDGGATYEHLHIVRNHIHHTDHTGEGMYLGCNNDGCRIANSIIERNYIHHLDGPNISQGDGIEIKEGSYGNIVRDNVIHDANYPCILTYGAVGNGPPNVIERNVMWNCGDHGIQSAADAVIRNNIILGAGADGIAMQPHQSGAPSNLVVVHNTVLNSGDAISVRNATGDVLIANNAVYSQGGQGIFVNAASQATTTLAGNVGTGGAGGLPGYAEGSLDDFVDAHFGGAPPIDVFPAAGDGLVDAADAAHVADDDFNTTPRDATRDVGAYVFDPDGNPGWDIQPGFKEFPDGTPGGDDDTGGSADSGGTGDDDGPGSGSTADDTSGGTRADETGDEGTVGSSSGSLDESNGCSCSSQPQRHGWWAPALLLLLAIRHPPSAVGRDARPSAFREAAGSVTAGDRPHRRGHRRRIVRRGRTSRVAFCEVTGDCDRRGSGPSWGDRRLGGSQAAIVRPARVRGAGTHGRIVGVDVLHASSTRARRAPGMRTLHEVTTPSLFAGRDVSGRCGTQGGQCSR